MSFSTGCSAEPMTPAAAVIVAGGSGRRMGSETPKQYLDLAGEPVLLRAVRPFVEHLAVGEVVVVVPPEDAARPPEWLRGLEVHVVAGGAERGDSVWNGLSATSAAAAVVLIHDGARPFVTPAIIDRVLEGAMQGGALAAVPVTDTVKEVGEGRTVLATPERARLWLAQTPQGFPREVIVEAYRRARAEGMAATDDAALVERLGIEVRVVEGAPENFKVTRPLDLLLAERVAHGLR